MEKRHAGLFLLVICGPLLIWFMGGGTLPASELPHSLLARNSTIRLCNTGLQAVSLSLSRGLAAGSFSPSGDITLWDMEGKTRRVIVHDGHSSETSALSFSADGRLLAAGPSKGFVRIYSSAMGDEQNALPWFEGTSSLAFSPAGTLLAVGGRDGSIKIWELTRRRVVQVIMAHDYFVSALAFSQDGTLLASSSWDRRVILWNLPSGTLNKILRQGEAPGLLLPSFTGTVKEAAARKEQPLTAVTFSPDGISCAAGAQDGAVLVWSVSSGVLGNKIEGAHHTICSLAYSSKGNLLVCGLGDGSLLCASPSVKKKFTVNPGHEGRVQSLAFADDDRRLYSASLDGTVIIWSVSPGEEPPQSP